MLLWYNSAMERRVYPLPVSAEIPAEAIRYSDVRSRVEIASEVTPVVNFRNANMRVLYEDLSMSSKSVGRAIGLSGSYAVKLLRRQGVVLRDSSDPIYLDRRLEATRRAFEDPTRRAVIIAKIHAADSDVKRSRAHTQRYSEDPEYRDRLRRQLPSAWEANRKNYAERKVKKDALAVEEARIKRERQIEFAQGLRNNPAFEALSPQQRRAIELIYRLDGTPKPKLRLVGEAMDGISPQRVQQLETVALIKLGVLKKYGKRSSQKIGG